MIALVVLGAIVVAAAIYFLTRGEREMDRDAPRDTSGLFGSGRGAELGSAVGEGLGRVAGALGEYFATQTETGATRSERQMAAGT